MWVATYKSNIVKLNLLSPVFRFQSILAINLISLRQIVQFYFSQYSRTLQSVAKERVFFSYSSPLPQPFSFLFNIDNPRKSGTIVSHLKLVLLTYLPESVRTWEARWSPQQLLYQNSLTYPVFENFFNFVRASAKHFFSPFSFLFIWHIFMFFISPIVSLHHCTYWWLQTQTRKNSKFSIYLGYQTSRRKKFRLEVETQRWNKAKLTYHFIPHIPVDCRLGSRTFVKRFTKSDPQFVD